MASNGRQVVPRVQHMDRIVSGITRDHTDKGIDRSTASPMSTLNTNEKQLLEKLFQMASGYVLNFSDKTMSEYFRDDVGIDIYDQKYHYASGSKANRMRGFWQVADDALVGKSVDKLIEYIDNQIILGRLRKEDFAPDLMDRGRRIASRLLGRKAEAPDTTPAATEEDFIAREFRNVSIDKLGLDGGISAVLNQRLEEIRKCLTARASLAVIFLCGSTLEGILLGIASANPKDFNQSALSPKDDHGKVKQFYVIGLCPTSSMSPVTSVSSARM